MYIRGINEADIVNYKKISMFIAFPNCSFKCDKEYGSSICKNSSLAKSELIETDPITLTCLYEANCLAEAIVIGGLEPFDNFQDLDCLVDCLRRSPLTNTQDDIVIYTGYTEEEISKEIEELSQYKNIIVKFGRYIPNKKSHYDELLGVTLASDNQYAKLISKE